MDLADFLLARIAEDEEAARASVTDYCDTEWRVDPGLGVVDQYDSVLVYREGDEPFIEHIARWDPARVLAKCAADRHVVGMLQHTLRQRPGDVAADYCLRNLGAVYADHPDFREEWRA